MKSKSKDKDSKKSKDKDSKKKQNDNKSNKSASKSKGKQPKQSKAASKSKVKQSKTPTKKQKSKTPSQISSIVPVAPPPAQIFDYFSDCIHHKSPFINFCQTCQELVCNQCTVFGPHNNHLHRILKMTDAYRLRKFYLVEAIRSNLVDKRDKIIAQLHRLEYRIEQIRFVKNIIERDIRSQYSGILQRLKNQQGIKLATLTHEVSLVQRQLDTINDLGNKFFELTNMECQKIEQQRKINKFLSQSKQMYDAIQYITNRPDRIPPNLNLQQLPRQVQNNRDQVKKALAGRQINAFKNQIIWKLLQDQNNQKSTIKRQIQDHASSIIKELSSQVQSLNDKLKKYKLICFFCGVRMNHETVNTPCQQNKDPSKPVQKQYETQKFPQQKHLGNGRHFFTKIIS